MYPLPKRHSSAAWQIWKQFFAPLILFKLQKTNTDQWNLNLWGIAERPIWRFSAKRGFNIPGLLYEAAGIKTQGIGQRRVFYRQELFVRYEGHLNKPYYDVEFGDQVFQLTEQEWYQVRPHLAPKGKNNVGI